MKSFFTGVLLFFSISIVAQIGVGSSLFGLYQGLSDRQFEMIKEKTTLFVVEDFNVEAIQQVIKDTWTYNDYEIISRKEYNENEQSYKNEKYAPFVLKGFIRSSNYGSSVFIYHHYFYYNIKRKKEKIKTIGGVFYSGDIDAIKEVVMTNEYGNMYDNFYNFGIGYFKNYLQKINKELVNKGGSFAYAKKADKEKLKALKGKTLYVPDYIKLKYNAFSGSSKFGEHELENPDDLFKKYKHSYEWIGKEELNEKILYAKEDFYYLMFSRVNGQKFITITNGLTGEMIYRDYQTMSYNIKKKDLSKINSKIK